MHSRPLPACPLWRRFAVVSLAAALAIGCGEDTQSPPGADVPTAAEARLASANAALVFLQVSASMDFGAGDGHTCGVTADNRAFCWGSNYFGQLGTGIDTGPETCLAFQDTPRPCSTKPVLVAGGRSFRQVSTGGGESCGVTTDRRAFCWGANYSGQLGDGTTKGRFQPVAVIGGLLFRQVDAGPNHTCGVAYPDSRAYCWGDGRYGQLGDGTTGGGRLRPVAVLGEHRFREVSVGYWHTCGVTTTNEAFCWGSNAAGQVGDSTSPGRRRRPVRVAGSNAFRQISAGFDHTCAVTTDDRAYCWGDGEGGQLGNGKRYLSFWPRAVTGGLRMERVTAGTVHTCGETVANVAYCWGFLDHATLNPAQVPGGLNFSQLSAGGYYTCGITSAGAAYCWGRNDLGPLGDGTTTERQIPTPVAEGS